MLPQPADGSVKPVLRGLGIVFFSNGPGAVTQEVEDVEGKLGMLVQKGVLVFRNSFSGLRKLSLRFRWA